MISKRVGIVGLGWVGKAMREEFPDAALYDEPLGVGTRDAINACEVGFVCVPTPNPAKGALDTSIVEQVVAWMETPVIVLRSTVNPGFTDEMRQRYHKRLVFQPEYLGETVAHPLLRMGARGFLILGGEPRDLRVVIETYQQVYNATVRIRQTDALTAELIKLGENRAIAHRVAESQELYDLCEAAGVDYYTVREGIYQDDPRMSPYWTFVYAGERGFNSKCIPKDVYAIAEYARKLSVPLEVTEALLARNERYLSPPKPKAAVG
ncbi:MAG TPA: hypothetical protein VNF74_08780 [Terriglobales bacterium]|nr:hypothetical protein [Terriglobales bacterium]